MAEREVVITAEVRRTAEDVASWEELVAEVGQLATRFEHLGVQLVVR